MGNIVEKDGKKYVEVDSHTLIEVPDDPTSIMQDNPINFGQTNQKKPTLAGYSKLKKENEAWLKKSFAECSKDKLRNMHVNVSVETPEEKNGYEHVCSYTGPDIIQLNRELCEWLDNSYEHYPPTEKWGDIWLPEYDVLDDEIDDPYMNPEKYCIEGNVRGNIELPRRLKGKFVSFWIIDYTQKCEPKQTASAFAKPEVYDPICHECPIHLMFME